MKRFSKLAFLLCLIATTALWAQFDAAEVLGTVRDPFRRRHTEDHCDAHQSGHRHSVENIHQR